MEERALKIWQARLENIKHGDHSEETLSCQIQKILVAIENQELSYQELGIDQSTFERLCLRKLHEVKKASTAEAKSPEEVVMDKDSAIQEFLARWHEFQAGTLPAAKMQLAFARIERLLAEHQIGPNDLKPFTTGDFWRLREKIMATIGQKGSNDGL